MRRVDVDPFLRCRFEPPTENPATWEDKGVRPLSIHDGQFQLAVEWRCLDRLPFHSFFSAVPILGALI